MVQLPWNKKQTYQLKSRPKMSPSDLTLVMTLTLNFQGQIWNLPLPRQKWYDCQETKIKHIDGKLCLKCDHQIWPWPWPWPWIFKVKYWICYISAKSWFNCHKMKSKHINWTQGYKCYHRVWPWTWTWKWGDHGDIRCRCAVDLSSFIVVNLQHMHVLAHVKLNWHLGQLWFRWHQAFTQTNAD